MAVTVVGMITDVSAVHCVKADSPNESNYVIYDTYVLKNNNNSNNNTNSCNTNGNCNGCQ